MGRDVTHPVWGVYDSLRTARLNKKYFSCVVARLERQNFWLEFILAATASGSAIGGIRFWGTDTGKPYWQSLMVVSAILAIAKPLLKFADRIQGLQKLVSDYTAIEYELKQIEVEIRARRHYGADLQKRFAASLDHMKTAAQSPAGGYRVNTSFLKRCQTEVERELPANTFFVPEAR